MSVQLGKASCCCFCVINDRDFLQCLLCSFDDFFELPDHITRIDDVIAFRAFVAGDISDNHEARAEIGDVSRCPGLGGDIAVEAFHFCRSFRVAKLLSQRLVSGKYEVIR